jgi:transcriptional regulator with XRE-family HTH domain
MSKFSIEKLPPEVLFSTAVKLRAIRKKMCLSQVALAERTGVSLGSLKRFEQSGMISLISFLKLLHVLGRLDEFAGILQPGDDMREIEKLFSE